MGQPSVMLKTKTAVPAYRFDSVKRSHLLEQMNNGLQCRLTFVNAPAGYGKTTLLCQWAHDFSGQLAWLSLDEKDNDLVRFWRYIVHMLTNASSPHLAENMENSMKATSHTSIFSFIDSLLNELATTIHQPLAIILDDYHVISESAIHDSLAYFIEYLPGNCHVYIASRSALPFSTAKWRLRSELVHLTPQQLLFDQAEAFSFCQQVHGLLLSEEQIASLVASTEGWVAGLQLAAISLSTSGNHERFFAKFTGAHRDISDYLFHEVLVQLPQSTRDFLLLTSVLSRLDAHVCNALVGMTGSQQVLAELYRQNIFLFPLDDDQTWYRYHHLFADFLRSQLELTYPGKAYELHKLASESFAARGFLDEAIEHAICACDYPLAVQLLAQHFPTWLSRGEFFTLLRALTSIPDHGQNMPPLLRLLYVFLLIACDQTSLAQAELDLLEKDCQSMPPSAEREQFASGLFFVRANLVFANGDFASWVASSSQLQEDLPQNPLFYHLNYNTTEPFIRRTRFGLKGMLSEETELVGKQFSAILEAHGWQDSLINKYVVQALAEGLYEENKLEESFAFLQKIAPVALQQKIPGLYVPYVLTHARHLLANQDFKEARRLVQEAMEIVTGWSQLYWISPLRAFQAYIALREGDVAWAEAELAKLPRSTFHKPSIHKELEQLAYVRLLLAKQQEADALKILAPLKQIGVREGLLGSQVEIANLQAMALQQQGNKREALAHLHEALVIGAKNLYVRSFLDEGLAMYSLLSAYQQRENSRTEQAPPVISPDYVQQLLELFPKKRARAHGSSFSPLPEPLTGKEMIILSMLGQGASNKQIAEELGNTVGTVKVYLHRIYGKLGVENRTQALLRAQEISLLEAPTSTML
ncbi:LuxR C-terminal-related transcriptional regulator [Brevibacillus parabrevis]|uniref:LuxR family transcriptional regulator n=1 Tax=Brevibacillus parabrevis TaxID=54914 RepID=A0A4Y3PVF8_BREPA|nr:LuxR C-terminal-related transcriptional regulator [Brevibacillus parabrevis]RNB95115.1 transcriptional regulator [Brevibacillus parabrevis]GEB35209.1 LuxR family transcriptional regulator [Brevibacillus parabrevis]